MALAKVSVAFSCNKLCYAISKISSVQIRFKVVNTRDAVRFELCHQAKKVSVNFFPHGKALPVKCLAKSSRGPGTNKA